ncbi:unnamed protein product (macronuclear) [Paramecium tetraurelia]|uniref:Uncharacterized protein n=1 Tax=Paramecium tetraurelia TaxID=5888 RepID=A0D777_PARTE|nr:uncharacterized protein GSPATT00001936001 [Paramecium tetraurelia]CAK78894.1 unnamed protein product [Paramecium tetraurelia]|eukprot:XP_001446291.1 hypothetical protein (macronuclear) [Paramecium tetraurelia strain d4-2]
MSEEDSQELESEQEEDRVRKKKKNRNRNNNLQKMNQTIFRKYNAFSSYAQLDRGQQKQYNDHNPLEYYYQNNVPIPYQPQVNYQDRLQKHQYQIDNANLAIKMLQNPKMQIHNYYDNYPPSAPHYPPSEQQYNPHFYHQPNAHHQPNHYQQVTPSPQYQRKRSHEEIIPNPYLEQSNDQRRRNSFKEYNFIPPSHQNMSQYPVQEQYYNQSPNQYYPQQQQGFQQPNQFLYQQPIQDEHDYYQQQNYPKQSQDNKLYQQQRPSRPPLPQQNDQKEEKKPNLQKSDDQQIDQEFQEFIRFKEAAKKLQKVIDDNEYQDFLEFKKSKLQQKTNNIAQQTNHAVQQTNNVGQATQQKQINDLYKRTKQIQSENELRPKFTETKFERKPGENYKQKYIAPKLDTNLEIQRAMEVLMKK